MERRRPAIWNADAIAGEHTRAEQDAALREAMLARRVGEHLDAHYKGHHFLVEVEQGVLVIRNPLLPPTMGMVIHLNRHDGPGLMREAMRQAGELLERFHLPRGRYNRDLWREASQKYAHVRRGPQYRLDMSTGKIRAEMPAELLR